MNRSFSLPPDFENSLSNNLREFHLELSESKKIADSVLRMSDFYIANPEAPTPWKESWCQIAQLAYFLPLNLLRAEAVFQEGRALHFPLGSGDFIDFGSGLGAGSWPWLSSLQGPVKFIEQSAEARKIHKRFLEISNPSLRAQWTESMGQKPSRGTTALFSYSLTELADLPGWVSDCDSLILIEPSTREDGRKLLEQRKILQAKGFSMWAPCPHQQGCPLLEDSKSDWCHDRIHARMPLWFSAIEQNLPMKNQTLTFSYLLASKNPAPPMAKWRTVGDALQEKGKTKQLLCRNSKRQFLVWMHRQGPAPEIPRGVLIDPPPSWIEKSNEIRVQP